MTMTRGWDLLFRRDDLTAHEIRPNRPRPLRPDEVRLTVERMGITTLTATYARFGDSPMRFMSAFPAPEGFGIVPVWGFATVAESRVPSVAVGSRYFGYLPMSTHHVVSPQPITGGFVDTTPERGFLHPWYRTFEAAQPHDLDDRRALLHPLFPASYNAAEFVHGPAGSDARTVVVTSASSKTAIGLAFQLASREGVATVGLTAGEHARFVAGLGLYDRVASYDDLPDVPVTGPTVFVDLTNSVERMQAVYQHLGTNLTATVLLGFTHPRSSFEPPALGAPEPHMFFTPAVEQDAMAAQGEANYKRRYAEAEERFLASTTQWLAVSHAEGPEALAAAVQAALAGKLPPDRADVLTP
ncbi:DUF2855 family protein [Micromonospora sp. WMMA1363]|uniref:DUF2855 family protein n=1 Tax=Micromonospora sp. WMMA1363 TaxID=3053985 RepID=UPI00259D089D|nr:DUF2855 family protein [Micromonospora sp. WMMA1363]MDM4719636.1 DUF2855 family protein [Micromonospora sp. WMMA1363]